VFTEFLQDFMKDAMRANIFAFYKVGRVFLMNTEMNNRVRIDPTLLGGTD
jgi:hypothetical protein